MMAIEQKIERKYIINDEQLTRIRELISSYLVLDSFCKAGEPYSLTSACYLYGDSEEDIKERLKVKKYSSDTYCVDYKKNLNGITGRIKCFLPLQDIKNWFDKGAVPKRNKKDEQQAVNRINDFLLSNHVSPKIFISSQRIAYNVPDDSGLRVTIDSNIVISPDDNGSMRSPLLKPGYHLLRIRYQKMLPFWFRIGLEDLGVAGRAFSSYRREYASYIKGLNKYL